MPAVSAIIPTRDRPDLLADCLRTLAAQRVAAGALEVVVIDDGSAADLRSIVAAASTAAITMRYERQQPAGLNFARNHGAAVAEAPVLAYLDDDTLVDPGWAAAVVDAFDRRSCDGLAGRIRLRFEAPVPRWLTPPMRSLLSELDLGDSASALHGAALPFGANCAVLAGAHERVGGFRQGLDRNGASLLSGGDTEFFARVRASGGEILYWPAAVVEHRVPSARLTASWFHSRASAQGLGEVRLAREEGGRQEAALAREVVRACRAAPILAKALVAGQGAVPATVWLAYCRGRFAGRRERSAP